MQNIAKRKAPSPGTKVPGTPDSEAIAQRLETFSFNPKSRRNVLTKYENLRKRHQ